MDAFVGRVEEMIQYDRFTFKLKWSLLFLDPSKSQMRPSSSCVMNWSDRDSFVAGLSISAVSTLKSYLMKLLPRKRMILEVPVVPGRSGRSC